jgi:hypothetical protein
MNVLTSIEEALFSYHASHDKFPGIAGPSNNASSPFLPNQWPPGPQRVSAQPYPPLFKDLDVKLEGEFYYRYMVRGTLVPAGGTSSLIVYAFGDLDGNGALAIFFREWHLVKGNWKLMGDYRFGDRH